MFHPLALELFHPPAVHNRQELAHQQRFWDCAFDMGDLIAHAARGNPIHAVLVAQMWEIRDLNHVRAGIPVGYGELVGERDDSRAVGSGGSGEYLDLKSPDVLPNVLQDVRNQAMPAAAHHKDAINEETQIVPGGGRRKNETRGLEGNLHRHR